MKNAVQRGDVLTLAAPYDVASGAGMLVGLIFGVATSAALSAATVEAQLEGVVTLTALTADTGTVGAAMYWDNTNKRLTTTSSGNTKVGVLTVAKTSSDTTATIRLNANF